MGMLLAGHPLPLSSHQICQSLTPSLGNAHRALFPSSLHLLSIPLPAVIYSPGGHEEQAPSALFIRICRVAANDCRGSSGLQVLLTLQLPPHQHSNGFLQTPCSGITSNRQEN